MGGPPTISSRGADVGLHQPRHPSLLHRRNNRDEILGCQTLAERSHDSRAVIHVDRSERNGTPPGSTVPWHYGPCRPPRNECQSEAASWSRSGPGRNSEDAGAVRPPDTSLTEV